MSLCSGGVVNMSGTAGHRWVSQTEKETQRKKMASESFQSSCHILTCHYTEVSFWDQVDY